MTIIQNQEMQSKSMQCKKASNLPSKRTDMYGEMENCAADTAMRDFQCILM